MIAKHISNGDLFKRENVINNDEKEAWRITCAIAALKRLGS
jgi:hypothetical protein